MTKSNPTVAKIPTGMPAKDDLEPSEAIATNTIAAMTGMATMSCRLRLAAKDSLKAASCSRVYCIGPHFRLVHPSLPLCGIATCVQDGKHHYHIAFDGKVHSVREAAHQGSPDSGSEALVL